MKYEILELHHEFCQEALLVKNYRPRTIKWYEATLKQFLKHYQGQVVYLHDITTSRLRNYLYEKRLKNNWTADTFLNQYKGLKAFLKWVVKQEYLTKSPIDPIETPRLEKKLPKRITKQEALKVLEYSFTMQGHYQFARYRNRAIFAVMIFTGLRAQETLNLKVKHLDMANRLLHVQRGKGGKDRVVPICNKLYEYH